MSSKDAEIKYEIETIINNSDVGKRLIAYFSQLPSEQVNRTLYIFSQVYPDNTVITDEEYQFIAYIFAKERYINELNFPQVVRAISMIDFSYEQRKQRTKQIENRLDVLAETCTFELDSLLANIFSPTDLMIFIEKKASGTTNQAILTHFQDILRYEKALIDYFPTTKINSLMEELTERGEQI